MNRTPEQHAEMLMMLWLAGQIIDAHVEHRMTFHDWLPLGPMAPDYDNPQCENTRTIRLLEDATAETQLLNQQAGEDEALFKHQIEVAGAWITANFPSDGATPGIALNIAGTLLHELNGQVLLPSGAQSVIDRTLNIFKQYDLQLPDPRVQMQVRNLLDYWQVWFHPKEKETSCSLSQSSLELPAPSGVAGLAAGVAANLSAPSASS